MTQKTVVQQLLDTAYKIREAESKLLEKKGINRTTLRGMVDSGVVTPEEKALILELYPVQRRPRRSKTEERLEDND